MGSFIDQGLGARLAVLNIIIFLKKLVKGRLRKRPVSLVHDPLPKIAKWG